jgi:hypothetical protein
MIRADVMSRIRKMQSTDRNRLRMAKRRSINKMNKIKKITPVKTPKRQIVNAVRLATCVWCVGVLLVHRALCVVYVRLPARSPITQLATHPQKAYMESYHKTGVGMMVPVNTKKVHAAIAFSSGGTIGHGTFFKPRGLQHARAPWFHPWSSTSVREQTRAQATEGALLGAQAKSGEDAEQVSACASNVCACAQTLIAHARID